MTKAELIAELIKLQTELNSLKSSYIAEVAENEQIVNELEESREKCRRLSEAAFESIFISENGFCLEQNKVAEKMFGYTIEEAVGKFGTEWISDEDKEKVKLNMLNGFEEPYEANALRKDGTTFPCLLQGKMINYKGRNVRVTTLTDITSLKQAEKALLESKNKKAAILRAIPDLIFVFDQKGNYLEVYTEDDTKLFIPRDTLIGKNISELFPNDTAEKAKAAFNQSLTNKELLTFRYPVKINNNTDFFEARIVPSAVDQVLVIVRDITELTIAREKIEESERKYRLIAENTSDGIMVIDANQKIQYVSPSYLKQIGYSEEEELSRTAEDIYSNIHPDDRDILFNNIYKAIEEKKEGLVYSYRLKLKKDHYIWREDNAKFNYDNNGNHLNTYVVCRDITERMKSQEILRESEEKFKAIANYAASWEAWFNQDGKLIWINSYSESLTGYTADEYMAADNYLSMVIAPEDIPLVLEKFQEALKGGSGDGLEVRCLRKDGSKFWLSIYWRAVLDSDGNSLGFRTSSQDISEKKKIMEDLMLAKDNAEESNRLKTAFLNNISHEIRTPFNGLLGFLSMMQEDKLSIIERDKYIRNINISANRFINTINDIVEISQIQAAQLHINTSETNIKHLMEELYIRFKTDTENKGLEFNFISEYSSKIEIIKTDRTKLYTILFILIGNAIKFTNKGSIEFGTFSDDNSISFYVKDTGIGIPYIKQQIIFESFMQADVSNTRQFEGSGLGLSIAKAYVEMLNGKIWLESEEEKGSCFYFTLLK
ncbi:MAG: PAS domain S-box protein [Bacteroidales bacterium]